MLRSFTIALLGLMLFHLTASAQSKTHSLPDDPAAWRIFERNVQASYNKRAVEFFHQRFEKGESVPFVLQQYFADERSQSRPSKSSSFSGAFQAKADAVAGLKNHQVAGRERLSSKRAAAGSVSSFSLAGASEIQPLLPFVSATPLSLPNGNVLVVYDAFPFVEGILSTDGGSTWSDPTPLLGPLDGFFFGAFVTANGRLFIRYFDFIEEGERYVYSDDEGATWSMPLAFPEIGEVHLFPTITQTPDGTLWRTGERFVFEPDFAIEKIVIRSSDGGETWVGPEVLDVGGYNGIQQIVSLGGDLLALYSNFDFETESQTTNAFKSSDGGNTWVDAGVFLEGTDPSFVQDAEGTWWAFMRTEETLEIGGQFIYNTDVAYQQSMDDGDTWNDLVNYTRFIGYDSDPKAVMAGGKPFITFYSERSPSGTWAGTFLSTDPAPPMIVESRFGIPQIETKAQVVAIDETGVAEVTVSYWAQSGGGSAILRNDGSPPDEQAGDLTWSGVLGPLEFLDCLSIETVTAVDIDGNETETWVSGGGAVQPLHDVGQAMLGIYPDGRLGTIYPVGECYPSSYVGGLTWPKIENYEFSDDTFLHLNRAHLFTGGPWVAATTANDPSPRVINLGSDGWNEWTSTGQPVEVRGTGVSDQDITVKYDDQAAPLGPFAESPPIGVEITQTSYQWAGANRDDFILFAYEVRNKSNQDDLTDVAVGLFLDTDINFLFDNPFNNIGGYDAASGLLYSNSESLDIFDEPLGFVGLKTLGGPAQAQTFIYNPRFVEPGSILPTDPFDEASNYDYLINGALKDASVPGDLRMLTTAPMFDLAADQSHTVYMGIVMGGDLDELRANAAVMDLIYAIRFSAAANGALALKNYVASLGLEKDLTVALTQKLQNAADRYASNKNKTGDNLVQAFINEVIDNTGGAIDADEAEFLIFLAGYVQEGEAGSAAKQGDALDELDTSAEVPQSFELEQNYPNPFNPSTTIQFALPHAGVATLKVFDLLGREVATVLDEALDAGAFEVTFDASNLASGVYLYQLHVDGRFVGTKRMVLMK